MPGLLDRSHAAPREQVSAWVPAQIQALDRTQPLLPVDFGRTDIKRLVDNNAK